MINSDSDRWLLVKKMESSISTRNHVFFQSNMVVSSFFTKPDQIKKVMEEREEIIASL
jgi:hypothetical protein